MRTAYKFLAPGAVSPFTRFQWPEPGTWVRAPDERQESWVFACRDQDLPYWLERELWVIELEAPVREGQYQISAPRARLASRITRWNAQLNGEYARACALRARALALPALSPELRERLDQARGPEEVADAVGIDAKPSTIASYLGDAARGGARGDGAATSYIACVLAATLAGDAKGFGAERAWQARWLSEHLGLTSG